MIISFALVQRFCHVSQTDTPPERCCLKMSTFLSRWSYHKHLPLLQVTQDPQMVLPLQWEELVEVEGADVQLVFSTMAKQVQSMLAQRDTHLEV